MQRGQTRRDSSVVGSRWPLSGLCFYSYSYSYSYSKTYSYSHSHSHSHSGFPLEPRTVASGIK